MAKIVDQVWSSNVKAPSPLKVVTEFTVDFGSNPVKLTRQCSIAGTYFHSRIMIFVISHNDFSKVIFILCVKVAQSCPTLRPHGLYSPRNSPGDLLNQVMEPRSPALQADSSTSGPSGKPHIYLGFSQITNILRIKHLM